MSDESDGTRGEYCASCDTWYHPKEEMRPFIINGTHIMMCMVCWGHHAFKQRHALSKKQTEWIKNNLK